MSKEVYYVSNINNDNSLGDRTKNEQIAKKLGWEITVPIEMTEISDVNGKLYIKGHAPTNNNAKDDLYLLKKEKLNQLTIYFDNVFKSPNTYFTSSLGFRVNARSKSLEDINGLIILNEDITDFNDFDDEIQKLTIEQLKVLQREIILSGKIIYKQKWEYREKILKAETKYQIENLAIKVEMVNFLKGS